jgi:hypothetical protein
MIYIRTNIDQLYNNLSINIGDHVYLKINNMQAPRLFTITRNENNIVGSLLDEIRNNVGLYVNDRI